MTVYRLGLDGTPSLAAEKNKTKWVEIHENYGISQNSEFFTVDTQFTENVTAAKP